MAPPHKLHSRCGKMGRGLSSTDCLADRGDRQKDRATCRFTFCALALGQRLHDSDATLKAFLSRRQADALQSKQRLGDISQGTAAGLRQHANSLFLKGCLFSVHVTNGGSIDGSSAPQQCTCVHTHTVFFPVTILLFLYFTQAACYVSLLSVLVKVWKDGCVPDFNGQTNVFQSVYKFTHSLNRANILFPYTREEVLSKESRFCFFP